RDALLQIAHLRRERGLVAHRARHATEERRDLGTRLREAEDVVDEQQHVLVLDVAEILRDREPRESDAQTRARRLVHLAVHERDGIQNPGFLELEIEIVSFARALTHAAEYRAAAVPLLHVVDELLNNHRLADAGAAEQSDLAALHERRDEIDDLDPRLED